MVALLLLGHIRVVRGRNADAASRRDVGLIPSGHPGAARRLQISPNAIDAPRRFPHSDGHAVCGPDLGQLVDRQMKGDVGRALDDGFGERLAVRVLQELDVRALARLSAQTKSCALIECRRSRYLAPLLGKFVVEGVSSVLSDIPACLFKDVIIRVGS